MKVKALKNFSCNGVRKKIGQFLSEEECEKIGDEFGEDLVKNDFLQIERDDEDSDDEGDSGDDSGDDSDDNSSDDSDSNSDDDSSDDSDSDDNKNDEDENPVVLDELDKPGLLEYAKKLDLEPHHNLGEEKLKEMIKEKLGA